MLTLIEGDCIPAMLRLDRAEEEFHLVYLDPPFFSQRAYYTRDGELAFEDRWPDLKSYLGPLRKAAIHGHDMLADGGSLVVHVDPRTSHHVKVMLDDCIGPDHFASEIIWRYRRWPSKTPNFQRVHDVLLRYVRNPSAEPRWTQLYEPIAASTRKAFGDRKQRANVKDGRRTHSVRTSEPTPGVPMGDVWEIGIVAPSSNERTGYPTQKSLKLMDRLVLSLTYPGDRVLDPMCGSGSMLISAARNGRKAVGIDSSPVAIRYAAERLRKEEIAFDLVGGFHAA